MKDFESIQDILEFAIKEEQQAQAFYLDLAQKMANDNMKIVFEEFAQEEKKHEEKLRLIKTGGTIMRSTEQVMDLHISDYLVDVQLEPNMEYEKALILAMKKEKAAYKLYIDLASRVSDPELVKTFESLANEEAKHKLRFETEYDEHYLQDN